MLLFITRKYPPSVGGMQRLSYYVTTGVAEREPSVIIQWGRSQKWLPFFLPYAAARALWVVATRPVTLIHIGDLVLAPSGAILRFLTRRPVVVTAHGLDVIYPNPLYQAIVPPCARRLDLVVCISEHTREQCLTHGIRLDRTCVIPVGIDPASFQPVMDAAEQQQWLEHWGLTPRPRHIMLTSGRLVPRKGVRVFVSQVLPMLARLRQDWVYLIIGDGPERRAIEQAISEDPVLVQHVRLLGRVTDVELRAAYAAANLFIMPNVPVPGDSEGFGIVHLEARAVGLPVVASDIDGVSESLIVPDDGILVPPGNTEQFVAAIDHVLREDLTADMRRRQAARIAALYGWPKIVDAYLGAFRTQSSFVGQAQDA